MIYHVTTKEDWEKAQKDGIYRADSLETDGFIHCSMNNQITAIAFYVFKGKKGLKLLCIDEKKVKAPVFYEDLRGHGRFPHVYGDINLDSITAVHELPIDKERTIGYKLPKEIIEPREKMN